MNTKTLYIRLAIITLLFLLATAVITLKLVDIQVVDGKDYSIEQTVMRTTSVEAARGELYDRNGKPLTVNRSAFRVVFDYFTWDNKNQNDIILKTCKLLEAYGRQIQDTLPISAPPYEFIYSQSEKSSARTRMEKFIADNEWDKALSASDVMNKLCEKYDIAPLTSISDVRLIAGIRYDMERRNFSSLNPFVLDTDVPLEAITMIEEQSRDYSGVTIEVGSVRTYMTEYAAHILGRTGLIPKEEYDDYKALGYPMNARIGRDGMEKALERYLRGRNGSITVETNLSGKVIDIKSHEEAIPGGDCYLTLDIDLQKTAEDSLRSNIQRIKNEAAAKGEVSDVGGGAAVVIDVRTSEVLACASYPSFDIANFSRDFNKLMKDPMKPMVNRAIAGAYPPGSVFKMVTATAALQEGVITPETTIKDEGIYRFYAPDYVYRCWIYKDYGRTHGTLNVSGALEKSCNYFFYEAARLLGIEKLNKYTELFGLGQKTGIELGGESEGVMAGPVLREQLGQNWYAGDTLIAAIGQSDNLFTPIQLANYMATIANGGTRNEVHLLRSVKSENKTVYEVKAKPMASIGYTKENLNAIFDGMLKVTEDGTASKVFENYPIKVIGKTGSAQLGSGTANGVFLLAAPYENPEIAIAVVVEHAGSGNNVAWIARDILSAYAKIKQD